MILSVFVFFLSDGVFAQKKITEPNDPKLPKDPKVLVEEKLDPRGENKSSEKNSDSTKDSIRKIDIKVTLCDGRQVKGKWETKQNEISFHHIKEGIRYKKTLPTKSIQRIQIRDWRAEFQKKEKDGTAYKMLPNYVWIQTESGENYLKDEGMEGTEYRVVQVENENGIATVYSMWIDLLYKEGNWYSKLKNTKPDELRTDCHKDVIREIEFPD